jgi:hypothetical protein
MLADYVVRMIGRRDECWPYPGYRHRDTGYGHAQWKGRLTQAHRASYEMLIGPIPDGLEIDHLCRNRPCCNPWHMEPVTQRVNLLRGESPAARQARQTHCIHGHLLSGDNLWIDGRGRRHCQDCRYRRSRENYYRRTGNRPVPESVGDYGKVATHCKRGHPWDAKTTRLTKAGTRLCRACQRDHQKAYRARQSDPGDRGEAAR